MHKILLYLGTRQALLYLRSRQALLTLLLFIVLFFPNSKVLAEDTPCTRTIVSVCSDGTLAGTLGTCPGSGGAPALPKNKDLWVCTDPSTGPDRQDSACVCKAGLTNPTGAATTPPPTSGGGQPCSLDGGKPIDLKPGQKPPPNSGVYTAIGCIPTEPKALVEGLLRYGTFAAGGIAFLLMILGALGLITAEGNPETIKQSQERFYSAIIGLLLIIFAVLLMQVIGVDILGLPEFGK